MTTDELIDECIQVVSPTTGQQKAVDFVQESYNFFSCISTEMQAIAKSFTIKYGKEEDGKIEWRILSETEQITVCPMECNEDSTVSHEDIPCNSDPCEVDYNSMSAEKNYA